MQPIRLLAFFLFLASLAFSAVTPGVFTQGSGSPADPYRVGTLAQLSEVRNCLTCSYLQTADIDMSTYVNFFTVAGHAWDPIGTLSDPFSGTYDGGGFALKNMLINNTVTQEQEGLFFAVDSTAYGPGALRNINLVNVTALGLTSVGGLTAYLGYNSRGGSITNCTVQGTLAGVYNVHVGGLVGHQKGGSIVGSSARVKLSATGAAATAWLGGLVGTLDSGHIVGSSAIDTIIPGYFGYYGGLVGDMGNATVDLSDANLVFSFSGTGGNEGIGGLVGRMSAGTLMRSYATGTFTLNASQVFAGGIVGRWWGGAVKQVYSMVNMSGTGNSQGVGGIVGELTASQPLDQGYYAGRISITASDVSTVGGLSGLRNPSDRPLNDAFWDSTLSKMRAPSGGSPMTTALLKLRASFPSSWNFDTVWGIQASRNNGYPILRKPLSITGLVAHDKTYDRNTIAVVTGGTLVGMVPPDEVYCAVLSANFSDRHAGVSKVVSLNSLALTGPDTGFYFLRAPAPLRATIFPAPVTISDLQGSKVYDATTPVVTNDGTLTGKLPGDSLTLIHGNAAFITPGVGSAKPILTTGWGVAGPDAMDYRMSPAPSGYGEISRAPVSVSGITAQKSYDGSRNAILTGGLWSGLKGSDRISYSFDSALFVNAALGVGKSVQVYGFRLSGTGSENYDLTMLPVITGSISQASLTVTGITVEDKPYDRTTAARFTGGSLVGLVFGDQVSLAPGTMAFASATSGIGKTVTGSGWIISGRDIANYRLVQPTAQATITPLPVHIEEVRVTDKTYDGGLDAATTGGTVTGALGGDVIGVVQGKAKFLTAGVGSAKPMSATEFSLSGAAALNYVLSSQPSLSGNIVPAVLQAKAVDLSKLAGASDPELRVSWSGFVLGEDSTFVTGLVLQRDPGESAGSYAITPSGATAPNYTVQFVPGHLTITSLVATRPHMNHLELVKNLSRFDLLGRLQSRDVTP